MAITLYHLDATEPLRLRRWLPGFPGLHGERLFLLTLPFDLWGINPSDADGNVLTKEWMDTGNSEGAGVTVVATVVGDVPEVSSEGGERS